VLADEIEKAPEGYHTRGSCLGIVQRGGTPTAFDRVLATALRLCAILTRVRPGVRADGLRVQPTCRRASGPEGDG